MRFATTITIFAVTSRLVALAIAKPIPNFKPGGMAIPLTRHSSFPNNESIDLDAISSHAISTREKILGGLDNYEMNTGMTHPFAVKRSESELGTRGASVPLTTTYLIWSGEISIGTPLKTFKRVYIDTGSADMWMLQTGCAGISGDRDLWNPDSSESAKKQSQSFQLKYIDGSIVEGDRYSDNVTVAGFTSDPQTFGSVTSFTVAQSHKIPFSDGLLGLAFPSISRFGAYPLIAWLVRQGELINPTFSFKLSSSGAEMYVPVGGANSMLYNGDITYTRVTNPAFWQVSMDDVRVDGRKILEDVPAIFDTGASHIIGDWNRVAELYGRLGGTLSEHKGIGYYSLPCDSFPTLGITFGGRTFEIPPELFRLNPISQGSPNCFGAIIGQRSFIGFWNIGLTFLQGVYSVFDYNTLRVGFAELA